MRYTWGWSLYDFTTLALNFQCHVQGFLQVETFHWIILQIIYRTCDILYLIYSEGACQFKSRPCGLVWISTRPFTVNQIQIITCSVNITYIRWIQSDILRQEQIHFFTCNILRGYCPIVKVWTYDDLMWGEQNITDWVFKRKVPFDTFCLRNCEVNLPQT